MQRPLRGSRISSFYPVKSLPQLSSLDSAFQLQEYISLLIRSDVHDVERIIEIPGKAAKDDKSSTEPKENDTKPTEEKIDDASTPAEGKEVKDATVDEYCWIYEHLRRLAQDLSHPLITMLQQECNRASCPEMKAGEWLYLCVAHGNDGAMEQCCAIDYILHTIDSATALLNSPRAFPSRLAIPQTSHRHFSSLARRLGRVFAHAYYHHREVFEQAEAESSLYKRFLRLTDRFGLVPREFLVIPGSGEPSAYETRGGPLEDTESDRPGGKVILGKEIPYEQAYPTWSRAPPPEREEPAQTEPKETHSSDSPLDPELSLASGGGPPGLSASTSPSPPGSGFARTGRSRTDTMVLHPQKEDKEPSSPPVNPSIPDAESLDTSSSQSETSSSSASLSESEPLATTTAPDSVEPTEQAAEEEVKEDAEVVKQDDAPATTPSDVEAPEADKVEEPEVTPSSSTTVPPSSEGESVEAEIASSEVPVKAKSGSEDGPVEEAQSESVETQEQAAGEEAQDQKAGATEAVESSASSAETMAPEEETKIEGGNDVVEETPTEEAKEDVKAADTDAETSQVSEDKKEDSKEEDVKVVDFGAATDASTTTTTDTAAPSEPAKEEEESKTETKEEDKDKDKESS